MWHIHDVKKTARSKMSPAYWKSVLVALILAFVTGSMAGSAGAASGAGAQISSAIGPSTQFYAGQFPGGFHWSFQFPFFPWSILIFTVILVVIVFLISIAINLFLLNPIESGCQRFFIINHVETGRTKIGEIFHGFGNGYLNVVKTMFLRDLYTILWTMLFIIPGIVKTYSYRLVPYILAEEPGMSSKEAFRLSRSMMNGNKWHAFLLDLSFIGWNILNFFTLGILGIFYVRPYKATADAEMYITIRDQFLGRA